MSEHAQYIDVRVVDNRESRSSSTGSSSAGRPCRAPERAARGDSRGISVENLGNTICGQCAFPSRIELIVEAVMRRSVTQLNGTEAATEIQSHRSIRCMKPDSRRRKR